MLPHLLKVRVKFVKYYNVTYCISILSPMLPIYFYLTRSKINYSKNIYNITQSAVTSVTLFNSK